MEYELPILSNPLMQELPVLPIIPVSGKLWNFLSAYISNFLWPDCI